MNIELHNNKVMISESEDSNIIAEYDGNKWIVTFVQINGISEYSCIARFSTRILSDKELIEKANILKSVWEYLELNEADDPISWNDETIQSTVNKLTLENHGQIKLNL